MSATLNMYQVQPEAIKAMNKLSQYVNATSLTPIHRELIKIRASQINGCAYCINMHTRDARKHGETEQRIYLLNAWRESRLFTEEEQVILTLTEQITMVSQHASDEVFDKAAAMFSKEYLAEVIMAAVTINAWNRIAITTRMDIEK